MRMQKRKFSNQAKLSNTEVFKKLNIEIKNILRDGKENSFIIGYLKSLVLLNSELEIILTNKNLSRKEQQIELEKLSQKNQAFDVELTYNLPKSLSKLINDLDLYLLNQENMESNDVSAYLPSVLAEKLGKHSDIKRSYQTKDVVKTINLLKFILRVFKYLDNSFGLFLIYNLVMFLRADFNNTKLKKQMENSNYKNRKLFFSVEDAVEEEGSDEIVLNLKRVDITSKFGEKLVQALIHLRNACLFDLQQVALKAGTGSSDFKSLDDDEKFNQICKNLESDTDKLELFKALYNFDTDIDSLEVIKLGMHCVYILESTNILVDHGLQRTKKKTYSKIKIAKVYADEIFSIPVRPKNLPMVVQPQFWDKDNKTKKGNLNYGGYLFNKTFNYPAIQNHHRKGITVITDSDLANINYIQSNFYTVNKKFLKYVETNFKLVVLEYLKKIPNIEFFFSNIEVGDEIKIKTINELFFFDDELTGLVEKFKEQNTHSLQKQITRRREYLLGRYKDIANVFFGLVHSYIIASHYKNYRFYFNIFIDSRGRLYYKSTGSVFGLQTGDFSRSLIDLGGNDYYYPQRIFNKCEYESSNKAYMDYVKSLNPQKESFQYIRIQKGILPSTISNDASCSGTSILSALIGYRYGLLLTNVVVETKNNSLEKKCVYNYFLTAMTNEYPERAQVLYSEKQLSKKVKELKITEEEFISSINYILGLIKTELLQREHVKQFVMRKNYSETNKGRLDYIYEYVIQKMLYSSNLNLEAVDKKIYKSCCYKLAEWIENLYSQTFSEIAQLCQLLAEHFIEKNPITLSCPNNSDFQYQQLLYKTVQIPRPSFSKPRKSDLSVYLRTDEADKKKIERSLVANFIHYLDSRLNFLVIEKCRINSVPLWTNHDCFYVCPVKKDLILNYYFESFIELLLEDNVIEHFLDKNDIVSNVELRSLLKQYETNRNAILNELKTTNLRMSDFILSS